MIIFNFNTRFPSSFCILNMFRIHWKAEKKTKKYKKNCNHIHTYNNIWALLRTSLAQSKIYTYISNTCVVHCSSMRYDPASNALLMSHPHQWIKCLINHRDTVFVYAYLRSINFVLFYSQRLQIIILFYQIMDCMKG